MEDFNPPEGTNFHCSEKMTATDLSSIFCRVVAYLQSLEPYERLRRYDDWWEHDGLHFFKGELDFHRLFAVVENSRALLESMPGDDYVRIGIAPVNGKWYLRFYTDWNESGSELEGDFDITVPPEWICDFREEVLAKLSHQLEEENAKDYYKRIIT